MLVTHLAKKKKKMHDLLLIRGTLLHTWTYLYKVSLKVADCQQNSIIAQRAKSKNKNDLKLLDLHLPRPCLDKSNSYQVAITKQMPQMISLCSLFFFSFFLHTFYRSFGILVPILPRHSPQNDFRFLYSSSGGKPPRRLGDQPEKKKRCSISYKFYKLYWRKATIPTTFSNRSNSEVREI